MPGLLPPAEPVPPLLIRLLGPLQVEGPDGAVLPLCLRPKEQRVLARLALGTGQVVPRDELLELFWPKSKLAAAERSLRTVVSSIRGGLRSVFDGAALALLRGRMDGYCLESAACAVDITLFTEAVQEARGSSDGEGMRDRALAAWRRAVDLYRGDLLSAFPYDDWCLSMRERLRDDFLDALFQLARASMAADALEEARELAARMVTLDPAEERAHRLLMRCYALLGRPAEALRQFERCRAALFEELGGRPAPATVALFETIRSGATSVGEEWDEAGDATAAVVAPIDTAMPERGRSG